MESSGPEKCICQICTCGRHRCRKHPQQSSWALPDISNGSSKLNKIIGGRMVSVSRQVYQDLNSTRPVIKKYQDNLQTGGEFHASSSMRDDFKEHQYGRPTIHRVDSALKPGSGHMDGTSHARSDFTAMQVERPVVKKLVDTLQTTKAHFEASSSMRDDYPEFRATRPPIHRLVDELKPAEGAIATTSLSQDEYREFTVQRPVGHRLGSTLKISGDMDVVSTHRSNYQGHEAARPTIHRIADNLRTEGELQGTSVGHQDFREFAVERPTVKRLQSSLKIAPGSMEQNKSLAQETYKEFTAQRPKINQLVDNLHTQPGEMNAISCNRDDYREFCAERPVIKKLQDNLAVASSGRMNMQPSSTDYGEHTYVRPIVKKLEDSLKLDGPLEEKSSKAKEDYVEFTAERPIIKKLRDNIPVGGGQLHDQTTSRDYSEFHAARPVINKLNDNLKMEGNINMQTGYNESFIQQKAQRPVIKRMHSTLAVGGGELVQASVIKSDFPQHQVVRPVVNKQGSSIVLGQTPNQFEDRLLSDLALQAATISGSGDRPHYNRQNRIKQMESSINIGKSKDSVPGAMTSLAQDTYQTLEGAKASKLARPRTSNRLQEWNTMNGNGAAPNGHGAPQGYQVRPNSRKWSGSRRLSPPIKMKKTAFVSQLGIGLGRNGSGGQHFKSTVRTDYDEANSIGGGGAAAARTARPPTAMHLEGDHDLKSTAQAVYQSVDPNAVQRPKVGGKVTDSTVNLGAAQAERDSLYKKSFTLPALQPCPAADLNNTNKSKYEFSREVSNHRFYKPVTIA